MRACRARDGRARGHLAASSLALLAVLGALGFGLLSAGSARAQDAASEPLVVHLDAALAPLGPALLRALARRTGRPVELGPAPAGRTALVLPAGHVGIVPAEPGALTRATVTLVAADGRAYETEVSLPPDPPSAAVRALALAAVDLADAALEAPPLPEPTRLALAEPATSRRGAYVYLDPEGGLLGSPTGDGVPVRPVLYVRALAGGAFGEHRASFVLAPGLGVGLCGGDHCVVIEGDLPLLEEQREAAGRTFFWRAVNLALRVQLRPIRIDAVTVGVTFGLLSRIGAAWIGAGPGEGERAVIGFGTRQSVELAWRIEGPFEWVVEAGVDVALEPARFVLGPGAAQVLEDELAGWALTALRVWP